jgi:hypothetical protein
VPPDLRPGGGYPVRRSATDRPPMSVSAPPGSAALPVSVEVYSLASAWGLESALELESASAFRSASACLVENWGGELGTGELGT